MLDLNDQGREDLEHQLMTGEIKEEVEPEPQPEALPTGDGEPAPQPAMTLEEMQAKLADLEANIAKREEELRQKAGAISEERDRRRTIEGQYAQLMDYIQEARDRASQQPAQVPDEDLEEYAEYLQAVEKKFGPVIQNLSAQLEAVNQHLYQTSTYQQRAQTFAQQSQEFAAKQPDYNDAMNFLVKRVKQRAELFYENPQDIEAVVAQEAQRLINFTPDQLYRLAVVDGYAGATPQPGNPGSKPPQPSPPPVRPKSLAAVSGATGHLPNTPEGRAAEALGASFADLQKIPLEDLDAILKNLR